MRKLLWIFVCIAVLGQTSWGQSKRQMLEYGDAAYQAGNYSSAVYFYSKIVDQGGGKFDVTFPYEVNQWNNQNAKVDSTGEESLSPAQMRQQYVVNRLADSYRQLNAYEKAVVWYDRATKIKNYQFPLAKYWYGSSLMKVGEYEKAQKVFDEFMEELDDESHDYHQLAMDKEISCQYAMDPENTSDGVVITKLDSVFNRGTASFAPNFYEGDLSLVFTSARRGNYNNDEKRKDEQYLADLFITSNLGDGWEAPMRMPMPLNSGEHEGSAALSADRTTFYFTRWEDDNKANCAIYVCKKFNNQWMQPLRLNEVINVDGYRSMNPSLSLDETRLYFASDRPGGFGGLDIWYCPINSYGEIGKAVNLGPGVNTPEDEMSPFFHFQTQVLYFSSEGHIGFGGMDIFKSKYNEDEESYAQAINVGGPTNSSKDDTYYILDKNQKIGYFTSDREACADCDSSAITGYCNKLYKVERPDLQFSISGIVFNNETMEPIPNALITVKDIKGRFDPFFIMTDDEGFYEKELEPQMDMFMKAQKTKFFGDAATVSTSGLTESTHLEQDFFLNPIPAEAIEIPGIEYDFDKATLRPKSKEILDELAEFLELNDNLQIEIQSHTDVRGNDDYNLRLSEDRAQSVVDYLVTKGIARSRMIPKGYGETKLLIEDAETEEEHQKNRRTAFKVISEGEVMIESDNQ